MNVATIGTGGIVENFLEACKQNDISNHHLFLFEAIVTLYMPNYALIKENLAKLGPLHLVQCNFSQYSSRYDALLEGKITNVFNPAFSGGALADIGIYNLHYVIGLFGKPKAMRYYPNMHACGIDTSGVAILEYDGFIATCSCAKDSTSKNISQLQGEKGYLLMECYEKLRKDAGIFFEVDQQ